MVKIDDLNSWIWADRGTRPLPQDAVYNPGYQPIAGYDNHWNWSLSNDVANLHDTVGGLDDVFVNTNRPDSAEEMEGPLGVPRINFTGNEEVQVYNTGPDNEDSPAADTIHIRQIDGNDSPDNALVYERYNQSTDTQTNILKALDKDNDEDSLSYLNKPIYRSNGGTLTPTPKIIGSADDLVEASYYDYIHADTADIKQRLYRGSVMAVWYDDDDDKLVTTSFDDIQPAVDAMPVQVNEYTGAGNDRTAGRIIIASKKGDNPYDGQVVIYKKGVYEGVGTWTELSHNTAGEATVLVDKQDTHSADDVYLRDLWIEHRADEMAIRSTEDETHLQDINLEHAGRTAIELNGDRCTASGIENKGGAFKIKGDQGYFAQILSHHELNEENDFPRGFVVQGNRNSFYNCHGWLRDPSEASATETFCVEFTGIANEFYGTASWSKVTTSGGRPTAGVVFQDDATRNQFSGSIQQCKTGVNFTGSSGNYVHGIFAKNDTDVQFGSGSDNVVSGHVDIAKTNVGNGQRNVVNGRMVTPHRKQLNGAVESVTVPTSPCQTYWLKLYGGGTLTGLEGPSNNPIGVTMIISCSQDVTLVHNDGAAANPFSNQSSNDDVLTDRGVVAYIYQNDVWRQKWINT